MTVRNAASMGNYGAEWESGGYCGAGNVAGLLGSLRGRAAVVCGNGVGVFEELLEVLRLRRHDGTQPGIFGPCDTPAHIKCAPVIFAVNDIGMYLPVVHHWVSLHADNLAAWKQVRWLPPAKPYENVMIHSCDARPYVEYVWERLTPLFCLSGYFAMQVAYLMGCAPIVLAGCPGDKTRRFFEAGFRPDGFGYGLGGNGSDKGVREQLEKEMERLPEFKSRVRSMSGWTKEFFGGL